MLSFDSWKQLELLEYDNFFNPNRQAQQFYSFIFLCSQVTQEQQDLLKFNEEIKSYQLSV